MAVEEASDSCFSTRMIGADFMFAVVLQQSSTFDPPALAPTAAPCQRQHVVRFVQFVAVVVGVTLAGCSSKSGSRPRESKPTDAASVLDAAPLDSAIAPDASAQQQREAALRAAREQARPGVSGQLGTSPGVIGGFEAGVPDTRDQARQPDLMGNDPAPGSGAPTSGKGDGGAGTPRRPSQPSRQP